MNVVYTASKQFTIGMSGTFLLHMNHMYQVMYLDLE